MSAETPIADELALLSLAVAEARAQVAKRHPVDMAAFAQRLEALCTRIGAAPGPEIARYAPDLMKLRDDLGQLAAEIREMVEELGALAQGGETKHPPPGAE